ncbi:MAG: hypothetical protein GJ676_21845 [Rhodobacteraceae bacterium]|nr:hypothetical protein [Paracoccaceae bacterium]
MAFVHLVEGDARYSFYDMGSAGRERRLSDIPSVPTDVRAMTFCSISLSTELCCEFFEELVLKEQPKRVIMLDPNNRPALVNHEAHYRQRLSRMFRISDIVKISEGDLDWLSKGAGEEWLRSLTGPLVLLTRGSKGCTVFIREHRTVSVQALQVPVSDTVGAGDAFNARLLFALNRLGCLTKAGIKALDAADIFEVLGFASLVAGHSVQ